MRLLLAPLLLLLGGLPLAHGQVILSGSYGRPITIGGTTDLRESWPTTAANADKLVEDFRVACGNSIMPAKLAGYRQDHIELPADGKLQAQAISYLSAPGVQITLWNGDPLALKGRASVIRDRGVAITGPVRDRDMAVGQCSLSARLSNLDGPALERAMIAAFGPPMKTVVKPGFADGEWSVPGPGGTRAVRFFATDLKKSEQLLHISSIPKRESK